MTTAHGFIPSPNSRWRYVGPPPGRGEIHRVIRADVHEVVTWSEPSPDENKPGILGLARRRNSANSLDRYDYELHKNTANEAGGVLAE
jgi:hypothetical protein